MHRIYLELLLIGFQLGVSVILAMWIRFSLFAGCMVHLATDRHLKFGLQLSYNRNGSNQMLL